MSLDNRPPLLVAKKGELELAMQEALAALAGPEMEYEIVQIKNILTKVKIRATIPIPPRATGPVIN